MWEFREERLWATPPLATDDEDPELCVEVCEKFEVIEKHIDLLSGNEKLLILLYKPYAIKNVWLERKEISEKKIFDTLTNKGLSVYETFECATLLKSVVVFTEENTAKICFSHSEQGFRNINGSLCFLGYRPMGKNFSEYELTSKHTNRKRFKPSGSYEVWHDFVTENIATSAKLTLAMLLGVTAPVVHILKEHAIFKEVPIFALVGDSSTGKTSTLSVISTPWFSAAHSIFNFNATSNALMALLKEQGGYPVLLDEASYTPKLDWSELIYTIPDGKDKLRCNGEGKLRDTVEYATSVIITSEKSVLERTNETGGQKARILEFRYRWFDDGESSNAETALKVEKITEFCNKNYGWGTKPIINKLLDEEFQTVLCDKFNSTYRELSLEYSAINGIEQRILKRIALILIAGWLFEEAINLDLNLKNVKKLLEETFVETRKEITSIDPVDNLYNIICESIVLNQSRFPSEASLSKKSRRLAYDDIYGVRGTMDGSNCIWILKGKFENYVAKQENFGFKSACKKLHEKGYLKKFYNDRFLKKEDFGSVASDFYCFLPRTGLTLIDEIETLPENQRTMVEVNKIHNEDHFGQENYNALKIFKNDTLKEKMALAFVRLTAQHIALSMNIPLKNALGIRQEDKVYLLPFPIKGLLYLSKEKWTIDAPYIHFTTSKNCAWSDDTAIDKLFSVLHKDIPLYNRWVLTDISIQHDGSKNAQPTAIINFKNEYGSYIDKMSETNPFDISDIAVNPPSSSNREYLISEENDEE